MIFYLYAKYLHCIKNTFKSDWAILTLRCVAWKKSVDKNNKWNQTIERNVFNYLKSRTIPTDFKTILTTSNLKKTELCFNSTITNQHQIMNIWSTVREKCRDLNSCWDIFKQYKWVT